MAAHKAFMVDDGTVDLELLRQHILREELGYAEHLGLRG